MKPRTVTILWIIAIVLGIAASIVKFGTNADQATRTTLSPGDKLIKNLPVRDITTVTLTQGDSTTTLTRNPDQTWGVTERSGYAVNYELLRNLLGALAELEVTQGYPSSSKHFTRFGLAEKPEQSAEPGKTTTQALKITIRSNATAPLAEIFLGKYSGTSHAGGRFVRLATDHSGVYAVGETFPGVTADPKDWLNKDFLKIDQIKSIALTAPADPTFQPWKLIRRPKTDGTPNPRGQFQLADLSDAEVMQITSTSPLRNLFSYTSFQDVLSEQQAAATANPDQKLKRTATITTHDGPTYSITFWPQKATPKAPATNPNLPPLQPSYLLTINTTPTDNNPAQPLVGHIYQVSQNTISPLQKQRKDFIKSKNKPTATTPPVHIPAHHK